MSRNVREADCDSSGNDVTPADWTAVIPAAGQGSRLGYAQPKILFPLLGRPIMDWLLDSLRPVCSRYVFVVSPAGEKQVSAEVSQRLGSLAQVVVQEKPTGMGDAVLCAEPAVQTSRTLVVWGDQVTLSQRTVLRCAGLHQRRSGAVLTFPTIMKPSPYIHVVRDESGRITDVLQARERKIDKPVGESDCGLFLFSTSALFSGLRAARGRGVGIGASTGEFNLLQTIPTFETSPTAVQTMEITDLTETLGVNTLEEAARAEDLLRSRALR